MAEDLDISPLAAEMIMQALRPVVHEHYDIGEAGEGLDELDIAMAMQLTTRETAPHRRHRPVRCDGRLSNSRYQAVRRLARRNGIISVLPERVYEELIVDDPDVEAPPVDAGEDTAVLSLWAPVTVVETGRLNAYVVMKAVLGAYSA